MPEGMRHSRQQQKTKFLLVQKTKGQRLDSVSSADSKEAPCPIFVRSMNRRKRQKNQKSPRRTTEGDLKESQAIENSCTDGTTVLFDSSAPQDLLDSRYSHEGIQPGKSRNRRVRTAAFNSVGATSQTRNHPTKLSRTGGANSRNQDRETHQLPSLSKLNIPGQSKSKTPKKLRTSLLSKLQSSLDRSLLPSRASANGPDSGKHPYYVRAQRDVMSLKQRMNEMQKSNKKAAAVVADLQDFNQRAARHF